MQEWHGMAKHIAGCSVWKLWQGFVPDAESFGARHWCRRAGLVHVAIQACRSFSLAIEPLLWMALAVQVKSKSHNLNPNPEHHVQSALTDMR